MGDQPGTDLKQGSKWWGNPVFVGLLAAALGLFGNLGVAWYQGHNAQVLARQKFEYDLIQAALNTDDPKIAGQRLAFLLKLGLLDDPDGRIGGYINSPETLPKGPWPGHKSENPPDKL